jgi:hypothetical protein
VVTSFQEAFGLSLAHRQEEEDDHISNFEFSQGANHPDMAAGGPPSGVEENLSHPTISQVKILPAHHPTQSPPAAPVPLTDQENYAPVHVTLTLPVVNLGEPASLSRPCSDVPQTS